MSTQILPTRTDLPYYDMQVTLDGVEYVLELRWNVRDAAWYMALSDAAENLLIASRKVTLGLIEINGQIAGLPPGFFYVLDTTGSGIDPGLNELGARVLLTYFAVTV